MSGFPFFRVPPLPFGPKPVERNLKQILNSALTGNLIFTPHEYRLLAEAYFEYKYGDIKKLDPDIIPLIEEAKKKKILTCIDSKLPSPAATDGECQQFGIKTTEMSQKKPPAGVYTFASLDVIKGENNDLSNVSVNGASFPDLQMESVIYDDAVGGTNIPVINNRKFKNFVIAFAVIQLILIIIVILVCIIVVTRAVPLVGGSTVEISQNGPP